MPLGILLSEWPPYLASWVDQPSEGPQFSSPCIATVTKEDTEELGSAYYREHIKQALD